MNARPHWQEFIKPYGRIALLNMSIHHLDAFRFLFGDPERILRQRSALTRATTSRTRTGWRSTSSSTRTACGSIGLDNCYTWVDHSIVWRVEGTEGIAKGTIGWPDYPAGSASTIDWTTRAMDGAWERPRWEERWFPQAFKGTMGQLMRAIQEDAEPEISGPDDARNDGARRGGVPVGGRGPRCLTVRGGDALTRRPVPARRAGRSRHGRGRRPGHEHLRRPRGGRRGGGRRRQARRPARGRARLDRLGGWAGDHGRGGRLRPRLRRGDGGARRERARRSRRARQQRCDLPASRLDRDHRGGVGRRPGDEREGLLPLRPGRPRVDEGAWPRPDRQPRARSRSSSGCRCCSTTSSRRAA